MARPRQGVAGNFVNGDATGTVVAVAAASADDEVDTCTAWRGVTRANTGTYGNVGLGTGHWPAEVTTAMSQIP